MFRGKKVSLHIVTHKVFIYTSAGCSTDWKEGRVDIRVASAPCNYEPEMSDFIQGIKSPLTVSPHTPTHVLIHSSPSICFATPEVLWKLENEEVRQHMVGAIVGIICVIFFGHIQFGSQAPMEIV